jgi:hypothetical protein
MCFTKNTLPDFTCKFFWDVDTRKIDICEDYRFVLERLLEYGDDQTLKWLMSFYSDKQRLEVIKNSRIKFFLQNSEKILLNLKLVLKRNKDLKCLNSSFLFVLSLI